MGHVEHAGIPEHGAAAYWAGPRISVEPVCRQRWRLMFQCMLNPIIQLLVLYGCPWHDQHSNLGLQPPKMLSNLQAVPQMRAVGQLRSCASCGATADESVDTPYLLNPCLHRSGGNTREVMGPSSRGLQAPTQRCSEGILTKSYPD